MNFHTVLAVVPRLDVVRRDWEVNENTDSIAKRYQEKLPVRRGDVTVDFADSPTKATIFSASKVGAAITDLEVEGIVGIGGLVLAGKSSRQEQRYAIRFMQNMERVMKPSKWHVPLPPLEVETRPLFYYVLFRLGGPGGEAWYEIAEKVIRRANGLGVALLRSLSCMV